MKTLFSYFSLLLVVSLFFSCSKDEDMRVESTLIDNSEHNISIAATNNEIEFRIEVLEDTTDNILGEFPNSDFVNFAFDANRNSQIDTNIDFGFSNVQNTNSTVCGYYFVEGNVLQPCGSFETDATIVGTFESTSLLETPHVVWTFRIPREELDSDNPIHFIVKIYSNGGYSTYPKGTGSGDSGTVSFQEVLIHG